MAQLLRLGMDGEDVSCDRVTDSAAISEVSVTEAELCFGGDSEPWL